MDLAIAIFALHFSLLLFMFPSFAINVAVFGVTFIVVIVVVLSSTLIAIFRFALVNIMVATLSLHICPFLALCAFLFHIVVVDVVAVTFVVIIVAVDFVFLVLPFLPSPYSSSIVVLVVVGNIVVIIVAFIVFFTIPFPLPFAASLLLLQPLKF